MEKTSTLIETRTSLPPMLEGPIKGQIKVHIPFLTLNKTLSSSESITVKLRWWGEDQTAATSFKPLSPGRSLQDLKTIAIFPVRCSLDMILSYLKDINELKLEVSSNFGRASHRLGLVFVALEVIKFGAPLAGLYPIKIKNEIIGEIFVSLTLENFKSKPEKEIGVYPYNEPIDSQITTLRKDTNNVLNQILSKAKDLRFHLQSTNGETSNVSFNFSERNIGFSLIQLLLERNETKIKKSVELLQSTNISEEDSLPDDSVLNSILYSKSNQVQAIEAKKTIETQTEDLLHLKLTDSDQNEDVSSHSAQDIKQIIAKTAVVDEQTSPKQVEIHTNDILSNESNYESLKNYSYFKVNVDTLVIGSGYKNAGWVFSVEVRTPWVGRESAISWNSRGHRTYNDFSVFHLLSDKVKNEEVLFKQDRLFPYYYCPELVQKHLEKTVEFIVEARNTHKRTKISLGKAHLKLSRILNHNMKISTDLKLMTEPDLGAENSSVLKVILEFLKITKKNSFDNEARPSIDEIKETLIIGNAPTLPSRTNMSLEHLVPHKPKSSVASSNKAVQLENLPKVDFETQTNLESIEKPKNHPEIDYPNFLDVVLSINEAIHLPIVYDSQRNVYYSPSTYVTCNLSGNIVSTSILKNTSHPVWNFQQKVIILNRNQLIFKLLLTQGDDKDIQKDKVLGFAFVDLRPLYKVDNLKGSYLISNENGEDCGELQISIWKNQKANSKASTHEIKTQANKMSDDGLKRAQSSRLKVNEFLKKSVSKLNVK